MKRGGRFVDARVSSHQYKIHHTAVTKIDQSGQRLQTRQNNSQFRCLCENASKTFFEPVNVLAKSQCILGHDSTCPDKCSFGRKMCMRLPWRFSSPQRKTCVFRRNCLVAHAAALLDQVQILAAQLNRMGTTDMCQQAMEVIHRRRGKASEEANTPRSAFRLKRPPRVHRFVIKRAAHHMGSICCCVSNQPASVC